VWTRKHNAGESSISRERSKSLWRIMGGGGKKSHGTGPGHAGRLDPGPGLDSRRKPYIRDGWSVNLRRGGQASYRTNRSMSIIAEGHAARKTMARSSSHRDPKEVSAPYHKRYTKRRRQVGTKDAVGVGQLSQVTSCESLGGIGQLLVLGGLSTGGPEARADKGSKVSDDPARPRGERVGRMTEKKPTHKSGAYREKAEYSEIETEKRTRRNKTQIREAGYSGGRQGMAMGGKRRK